ncbi:MAG TPA: HAMP domain-containing sensor histidine kinase, partial [Spirosoma sp.]|nr:HAMP domain-containing sensor histidine kinase [Spirosoma sp.]
IVYNQEIRKQLAYKRAFGRQLLAQNDEFGEFLLSKARQTISRDAEISRSLQTDSLLMRVLIKQRVKGLYLDKYLDKYDVGVWSFRANGQPLGLDQTAATLVSLGNRYRRPAFQTKYPGVYLVREEGNQFVKQYICFVAVQQPVPRPGPTTMAAPAAVRRDTTGYVVLDLRLRSERPASSFPELLIDSQSGQIPDAREHSYAVYGRERSGNPAAAPPVGANRPVQSALRLLYSTGTYNYERKMPSPMLASAALFGEGLSANEFQHVAQRGRDGRLVIVSSAEYPYRSIFSNFSFLFLLLVLTVVLGIVANALDYGFSPFSINYSTRIQILLNVAFFLPLLLVIVIILSVIGSNNVANQENAYISQTRNIAANFLTYLDEHLQGKKRSRASLDEELSRTARDAGIDINLFDTQGQLYTSTHPLLYESGYLSNRINPEAYIRIAEDRENQILLNESVGNRQYRTAYAGIKSYDGRLLGILSIPYFYARSELDRQIIDVFAPALSIFTALFLFFLVLSYFASNVLTKPLRLLTQKIRKTNLDRPNDPLPWHSDDEIGLLIREYNRMLVKLEESRRALTRNEKQSAWREMAKQVAHEIKNPLTPMKLTLQHLKRTFPTTGNGADVNRGGSDEEARSQVIQRTFDSLLDQIDNLSDIATSFSDFAKMPVPRNDVFEITGVLNKAADLYADDSRITLQREIATGPVRVIGDRQLLGRVLTNLLINAIQSVPPGRKPSINLKLFIRDDEVQLEIHDNGSGIPEAIRTKVFLPNFSTKRGGSGLGLAIAKRGVEHAGGSIWFETTEDVGTSFYLLLRLSSLPKPSTGQPVG